MVLGYNKELSFPSKVSPGKNGYSVLFSTMANHSAGSITLLELAKWKFSSSAVPLTSTTCHFSKPTTTELSVIPWTYLVFLNYNSS